MLFSQISHKTMTLLDIALLSNQQEFERSIADDALPGVAGDAAFTVADDAVLAPGVADDAIRLSVADDATGASVADDAIVDISVADDAQIEISVADDAGPLP